MPLPSARDLFHFPSSEMIRDAANCWAAMTAAAEPTSARANRLPTVQRRRRRIAIAAQVQLHEML